MDPHVGFAVDERQHAAAFGGDLWAVDHDLVAVALVEGAQGVLGEFDLVGSDVVHAEVVEIVDRCTETDCFRDHRGAGFELPRNLRGGEAFLGDVEDHLATAEEGRHRLEKFGPGPQDTDAHRAEHLVAGEDEEVGTHCLHVGGHVGHILAAVDGEQRTGTVGGLGEPRDVVERAEHIGHRRDRHQFGAIEQGVEVAEIEVAVGRDGNPAQLEAFLR